MGLVGTSPPDIDNLSFLVSLNIIRNKSFSRSIPNNSARLYRLELLHFGFNDFSTIPSSISNISKLQTISLSYNLLSSFIPSSIFNISTLRDIFIRENKLLVQTIELGTNKLSRHLPSNTGNFLPNLHQLYLGGNQLSGIILNSISNASLLIELELAYNSFSSLIPNALGYLRFLSSIGNLSTSLQYFGLGHYCINGNILREIGNLSSLTSLLLDNNQFVRPIPTTAGKLHKLEALYLQNNKLEASNELTEGIPECMGKLNSLRNLYLAFNQLTSMVPLSLWNLTCILEVNLSSSLQDGSLPIEMGNMMVLRILDLSRNQLSGKIPSIGPFENFLVASFMSIGNIAIKVLNLQVEGAFKTFVATLNSWHFVLEYMPNGNLEKWLYSHNHNLNILQRLNIMVLYVTLALEYLHYGYSTTIVHCDLKPSNILLDQDLVAHDVDFGMAKLLGDRDSMM
ncbi:hypothetical protein I3842_09G132900 [Carya illinoinensis]|uniref:Protein kinase domain-containing protein n=1 Tax=Carya illinoinensis TaxID=32201 RepID=A0A922E450_CARIL|nr:hypothetical protein I3842_09G132900 [Carya illinoinensis]